MATVAMFNQLALLIPTEVLCESTPHARSKVVNAYIEVRIVYMYTQGIVYMYTQGIVYTYTQGIVYTYTQGIVYMYTLGICCLA